MGYNKIQTGDGRTLMDLTQDTTGPDTTLEGYTGHDKAGNGFTGRVHIPQSAYQDAQQGGYTGTEPDFQKGLADAVRLFDKDIPPFIPVIELDGEKAQWDKGYYWKPYGKVTDQYTQKYYASPMIEIPPDCDFEIIGLNGDVILFDAERKNGIYVIQSGYAPAQKKTFTSGPDRHYLAISTVPTGMWTPQRVVVTRTSISQEEIDAIPANSQKLKALYGKKVVCFGDSLFGINRTDTSSPAYAARCCGATVYNCGFSGCRMSVHTLPGYTEFSMWALAKAIHDNNWTSQDAAAAGTDVPAYFKDQLEILKSVDFVQTDFAVIHYGTNDFAAGVPIPLDGDNPLDYNTICGALRYSINQLQTAYPRLQIYVSVPVYRFWVEDGQTVFAEDKVRNGIHLSDVCAALAGVAREYNLPVIDGYHGLNINKDNASTYLEDGTHHNQMGRERFGTFIGECLTAGTDGFGWHGTGGGVSESKVQQMIDSAIGGALLEAY